MNFEYVASSLPHEHCPWSALITCCLDLGGRLAGSLQPVTSTLHTAMPGAFLTGTMVMSFTCLMSVQGSVTSRINVTPLSWQIGSFLAWPQSPSSSTLPVSFPNAFCDLTMCCQLLCRHPVLSLLSGLCICCSHYLKWPPLLSWPIPAWKTSQLKSWLPGVRYSQGTSWHFT